MADDTARGRYVGEETPEGVRIYDAQNDDAWVQSDETVDLVWQA